MMKKGSMAAVGNLKALIVCADDFGMNLAANRGILALAQRQALSAASCLVDGPYFEAGAAELRETALQKGLHLNFTDNLGQPGLHRPLKALIRDAYLYRLDSAEVRLQVVRQLDRYEAVMGAPPDYVDGHLHVHQLPQIRDELIFELARRYRGRPGFWVRSTIARAQPRLPFGMRLKARIIERLGSRALVRLAHQHGFETNERFLGVYDFRGGAATYAKYLDGWLCAARSGDVLMCHPERYHPEDTTIDPQRNAEFDTFNADAFALRLQRHRVCVRV